MVDLCARLTALRKEIRRARGLQLILAPLDAGGLDAGSTLELGEAVVANNAWIAGAVLRRFREKVAGR